LSPASSPVNGSQMFTVSWGLQREITRTQEKLTWKKATSSLQLRQSILTFGGRVALAIDFSINQHKAPSVMAKPRASGSFRAPIPRQ
jgi:hypothetical protein